MSPGSTSKRRASFSLSPPHSSSKRIQKANRDRNNRGKSGLTNLVPSSFWSVEDQIVLDATYGAEITVWKRTLHFFEDIGPSVIPKGKTVEFEGSKKLPDLNGERTITNTSWTKAFCDVLNALLCCPALNSNLNLLRFAIQAALYYRLRQSGSRKKPKYNTSDKTAIDYL